MVALTEDEIRLAPKALLHDHLDGGLRPQTVLELADEAAPQHVANFLRYVDMGYFSGTVDGYESVLTPELLEEMLRAELLSEEDEPLTRRERLLQTMKAIKEKRHEK